MIIDQQIKMSWELPDEAEVNLVDRMVENLIALEDERLLKNVHLWLSDYTKWCNKRKKQRRARTGRR